MAGVASEETGAGRTFEGVSSEQQQSRCQAGEALAECRSLEQVENGSPSTSPPYWDSDDDDDDGGLKPSDLYGKYTWKIDKFSQINKRELRSNAFEVGGYKWYILIYPQGCDVCNHLSLFLCVANHDKLLPGWSHFAQFTIAVVNKEAKKSKYSDTLHRFWKKEHDWGWKKFMELSKVMDGFIDADTLIIKAQVQVIRERPDRPFRCLDCQYRRELVRVYLTNVEQICRRFVEERRAKLGKLLEDKARWSSFCAFWLGMDQSSRRRMSREKTEPILKVVVKHFFIEKEVTSTLVMDSLYSGLKALEGQNKIRGKYIESEELPVPIVGVEKDTFILVDDVLLLLERAAVEPLPPKDDKGPQNRTKDGTVGEEFNKESIERDERRLTELGRRTIEIFVLAHIFSKIEVAYQEAVALKKQEELIREEEAAWLAESEQKARRGADKEKKSKKKQGKQKKNNRKAKDKVKIEQDSCSDLRNEIATEAEIVVEKAETVEDASDASDSAETLVADSDNRGEVNWDTDPPMDATANVTRALSAVRIDDSSSTCSSDSVLSVRSMPRKGNDKNKKSPTRGKMTSGSCNEEPRQPFEAFQDARNTNDASRSSIAVELPSHVRNGNRKQVMEKGEEAGPLHKSLKSKDAVDVEARVNGKVLVKNSGPTLVKKASTDSPKQAAGNSKPVAQTSRAKQFGNEKQAEKVDVAAITSPPIPVMSRPLSAAGPRPAAAAAAAVSVVQTAPALARSVSAAGRVGPPEYATQQQGCYVPQSYRNAIIGGGGGSQNHSVLPSYSQPMFSQHASDRMDTSTMKPTLSFGMVNHHHDNNNNNMLHNGGSLWINGSRNLHGDPNPEFPACTSGRQNHVLPDEFPHLDIINSLFDDEHRVMNPEYQMFSSPPHPMSRQYTFPGGEATPSNGPSCRRSYHDDGFQHGYGRSYDTLVRDMVPSSRPYVVDGFMPNQWQMAAASDPNVGGSDGYPYHLTDYPNHLSVGVNGYTTMFRPSNGL